MIDHEVLDELRRMTGGMFRRILEIYLKDAKRYTANITDAMANHDMLAVQKAAHALKSASGQVGALRLQDLLEQLEDAAKHHSPAAAKILNGVQAEYDAVLAALAAIIPQS